MRGEWNRITCVNSFVTLLFISILVISGCGQRQISQTEHTSAPVLFFYGASSKAHSRALATQSSVIARINPNATNVPMNRPVRLNIVDGREFTILFQRRTTHTNGDVTLTGYLREFGAPYGVVLTMNSRVAFGRIQTPQGLIRITTDANGILVTDVERAGLQAVVSKNDVLIPKQTIITSRNRANTKRTSLRPRAGVTTTIDVLVLYSSQFAARFPSGVQTRINELVAVANKSYFDSQIDMQLRVVDSIAINLDETKTSEILLSDMSQSIAPFENAASLRNERGADMVVVLRQFRANAQITCGVSWLNGANGAALSPDLAYSIVADGQEGSYFCEDITLAHEVAHGMGSSHDVDNSDAPGVFPYSYGWGKAGVFGTVMSYIKPQSGFFSNPNIKTCFDQVCGVADVADNARSLNNVREQVAAFRASTTGTRSIPLVATLDATQISATSAMFSSKVGTGSLDTNANFEYGTQPSIYDQSTSFVAISASVDTQFVNQIATGLQCGTTYYFRAVATNSDGTAQGVERSFITSACAPSTNPSVVTRDVTDITAESVRLNGVINPQGFGGQYYFDYGELETYGQVTISQAIGNVVSDEVVAANINSLVCNTTYHARLRFKPNTGSEIFGNDIVFTTQACGATPTVAVSDPIILDVSANSAQLSTSMKTSATASVYFEYGATAAFGNKTAEQNTDVNTTIIATINGLSCGQTYFVRAAITVDGTNIVYSADRSFTTSVCQLLPPLVGIPNAKGITANSAEIQININANNLATTTWVEYGLTTTLTSKTSPVDVTPIDIPVTLSLLVSDLNCESTYRYRIVANNPDGLAYTDIANFTTAACPPATPIVTQDPVGVGLTGATLSALIGPHDQAISVWFEYGIVTVEQFKSRIQSLPLNSINYEFKEFISDLNCETNYLYRIAATINGQIRYGEIKNFSTMSCLVTPTAIMTLDPANIGVEGARLRATVNPGGNVTSVYFEYGVTSEYGQKTPRYSLGSPTVPRDASWNVTGLLCGTVYHYRAVLIYDNGTATGQAVAASDVVFSTDACKPLSIREAVVLWSNDDSASISVSMDTAGIASEVFIEFGSTESLGEKTETVGIGSGTVTFQLYNLICGTPYYFRVVAANPNGGAIGSVNSFSTKPCAQQPLAVTEAAIDITSNMAKLSSRVSPNGARTSVYFEYGVAGQSMLRTEPFVVNSSFSDQIVAQTVSGLQCESTYSYRVIASNANGNAQGESLTFTTSSCQGAINIPSPVVQLQIVAGSSHGVAIDDGGRVLTWGDNQNGQLGVAPGKASKFQALQNAQGETLEKVIRVAAGGRHTLALLEDGSVLAWGDNTSGQLANGNRTSSAVPGLVVSESVSTLFGVVGIASGDSHNLALMRDGTVRSWGSNQYGQLGNSQKNPRLLANIVAGIGDAIGVAAGSNHSFALQKNGTLLAWGDNRFGQLGDGSTDARIQPTIISLEEKITAIAAGERHTLALTESGNVLSWGDNEHGQLGFTPGSPLLTPQIVRIDGKPLANVTMIAAGKSHSLALRADGSVVAWGDNADGQLGIGDTELHAMPVSVITADQQTLTNVDAIAAGSAFSVALTKTGNIVGWGNNAFGQLGTQAGSDTVLRVPRVIKDERGMSVSLKIPRILVSPEAPSLRVGDRTAFEIRLSSPPGNSVTITINVDANGKPLEVIGSNEFVFDATNWDKPQQFSIRALRSEDGKAGRGSILFSATGLPSLSVNVSVEEAKRISKPKGIGAIDWLEFALLSILGFRAWQTRRIIYSAIIAIKS